jgi:hypothetical protein
MWCSVYSRGAVASNALLGSTCVYPVLFFQQTNQENRLPQMCRTWDSIPLVLKSGSASARASSILVRFFTGILNPPELALFLHAVCFVGISEVPIQTAKAITETFLCSEQ